MEDVTSYGLKETKEVLKFVIELGLAVDKSLVDKKIGLDDAMNFYSAVLAAGDAFDSISLVVKELADLDAAEKAELISYVENELDLISDRTEEVIEKALSIALNIYEVIKLMKA
jgi:hypothetical protein